MAAHVVFVVPIGGVMGLQAPGAAEDAVHVLGRDGIVGGSVAVGAAGHEQEAEDERIAGAYNVGKSLSIREKGGIQRGGGRGLRSGCDPGILFNIPECPS